MFDNYSELKLGGLALCDKSAFPEDCLYAEADDKARFKAYIKKIKDSIKSGDTSSKRFQDYLGSYKHYTTSEGWTGDSEIDSFINSQSKYSKSKYSYSGSNSDGNPWDEWANKRRAESEARAARSERDKKDAAEGDYMRDRTKYYNKIRGAKVTGAVIGGTLGGVTANLLAKKVTKNMKSTKGKKVFRAVSTLAGTAAGGYGGYKAGGKLAKKFIKRPTYQTTHSDQDIYSIGKRLRARVRREYYGLKGMYGGSDASSRNRRNDLIATSAMGSIAGAAMGYGVTKKAKNKSAAAIKDRRRRVRKNVVIGALVGTAAGAGTAHAIHRSDLGTLLGDRPSIGSFDFNTSIHRKLDFQDMVHKGRYGEKERLRRAGNRKGWKSGYDL